MIEITRRTALGGAIAVPAAAALTRSAWAADPVAIDLFFPVPVQGKLADKMKELIDRFNGQQSTVKATAVYTGSYDDTSLKTRAAAQKAADELLRPYVEQTALKVV
jgi:sn-glycerol 3-phosphate transport system substrate-binding protein